MNNKIIMPTKRALGIDIADHTIEIAELRESGGRLKVNSLSRTELAEGIVANGRIKKRKELVGIIRSMLLSGKPLPATSKELVFGLPDSQVYYHCFEIGKKDIKNAERIIYKEAGEIFPIEDKARAMCYRMDEIKNDKMPVYLFACRQKVISEWRDMFLEVGLRPRIFDIEILALYRGLKDNLKKPVYLLDIGHEKTVFSVFENDNLLYAYSFKYAGKRITEKIAELKNISLGEAEKLKISGGLETNDTALNNIIKKSLVPLLSEIKNNIEYNKEVFRGGKNKQAPKELIIAGGTGKLKGLAEYLKNSNLGGLEVKTPKNALTKGGSGDDLLFIEAAGLAARLLRFKEYKKEPFFKVGAKGMGIKTAGSAIMEKMSYLKMKADPKPALAVFLLLVSFILFYSYFQERKPEPASEYAYYYALDFLLPISLEEASGSSSVRGRVVDIVVGEPAAYEQAISRAVEEAEKKSGKNDSVWPAPLNEPDDKAALLFPKTFSLLIYNNDYESAISGLARERLLNSDMLVRNISLAGIVREKEKIFFKGKADLSLKMPPELKKEIKEKEEEYIEDESVETAAAKVKIKQLGKSLNVRMGPGTGFNIIGGAEPGREYDLLEEQSDWYKIRLEDREGWVSAGFTDKLE